MMRRANQISDAVIRERREVTLTGAIVGHYETGGICTLIVQVPADSLVRVEDKS